jgi:hypothetical protein
MISQVYISPALENTFGENFRKFWNLRKYDSPNLPAVFFGLYTKFDLEVLSNHNSISLIIWGGGDMKKESLELSKKVILNKKGFTFAYPGEFSKILSQSGIPHKQLYVPIKDYSNFIPLPLGDKIYVYRGVKGTRSSYFQWDSVICPLIEYFGENKIIYTDNLSISELIENYYSKCFIYVKPTPKGGCTAMFELAHMGRKTVGQGHENLPNFIEYNNVNHLIKIIEKESKNIGTLQEKVSSDIRSVFLDSSWLDLNFWKK